jgi:hypothetical protein
MARVAVRLRPGCDMENGTRPDPVVVAILAVAFDAPSACLTLAAPRGVVRETTHISGRSRGPVSTEVRLTP